MITYNTMDEPQAYHAMQQGEFEKEVIAAGEHVAVILTQGWCRDWMIMQRWMQSMIRRNEPKDIDIIVWVLMYDRIAQDDAFRTFKETKFNNDIIPYIRYYSHGKYRGDSNHVSDDAFIGMFT